jgi:hypothetical protein
MGKRSRLPLPVKPRGPSARRPMNGLSGGRGRRGRRGASLCRLPPITCGCGSGRK